MADDLFIELSEEDFRRAGTPSGTYGLHQELMPTGLSGAPGEKGTAEVRTLLDTANELEIEDTATRLYQESDKSPEQHAKIIQTARDLGLPESIVGLEPETMQARAQHREMLDILHTNPTLREYYASPNAMKLSRDDVAALRDLNDRLAKYKRQNMSTIRQLAGGVYAQWEQATGGVIRALGENFPKGSLFWQALTQLPGRATIAAAGGEQPTFETFEQQGRRIELQGHQRYIREHLNTTPGSLQDYAVKITEGAAAMMPGLIVGLANAPAGLTIFGLQAFGNRYSASRARGWDPDAAFAEAAFFAALEIATERIPLLRLTESGGGSLLRRALKSMGAEAIQETIVEYIDIGFDVGILNEQMTITEALGRLMDAGIIGAGVGGLLSPMGYAGVKIRDRVSGARPQDPDAMELSGTPEQTPEEVRESLRNSISRDVQSLWQSVDQMRETTVAAIDPTETQNAGDAVAAGTEMSEVLVDPAGAVAYFQNTPLGVDGGLSLLGTNREALDDALEQGDYLTVSFGQLASTEELQEHRDGLSPYMKLSPDSLTQTELQLVEELENSEQLQGVLARIANESAAVDTPDAAAVYTDVYQMLRDTGMTDPDARVNATIMRSFFNAMAPRIRPDLSPLEMYRDSNFGIQGMTFAEFQEARTQAEATSRMITQQAAQLNVSEQELQQQLVEAGGNILETEAFRNWFGESQAREGVTLSSTREVAAVVPGRENEFGEIDVYEAFPSFMDVPPEAQMIEYPESVYGMEPRGEPGAPAVYYHGTSEQFEVFEGDSVAGHFTRDRERASEYGDRVMEVYLRFTNPAMVADEAWRLLRDKPYLREFLQDQGYDAVISDDTGDVIIFDPKNVKSVQNRGTFDPESANILEQSSRRAGRPQDISAGFDGRTMLFNNQLDAWRKNTATRILKGQPLTRPNPVNQRNYVLETLERTEDPRPVIMLPKRPEGIISGRRNKGQSIPAEVWLQLPELMQDPVAVYRDQTNKDDPKWNFLIDTRMQNGDLIVVGVRQSDGTVLTITPREAGQGYESTEAHVAAHIKRSREAGETVYIRNRSETPWLVEDTRPARAGQPVGNIIQRPGVIKARGRVFYQSAVPLQNRPLNVEGSGPGGRVLNWDLGAALTERHMEVYERALDPINDEGDFSTVLDAILEEYDNQQTQQDSGNGWYAEDIEQAIEITTNIIPELADSQENVDLFLTLAALLSPQQKPIQNWENAILAFQGWLETGRVPLKKPNGKNFGVPSHTTGLQLMQHLIDTHGLQGALEWVQTPQSGTTIAETRRASGLFAKKKTLAGYTASETNLKGEYLGIYMMGPKVGDFMLNATGIDPEAVTVDLWAARTYNRLIGRLLDVPPKNFDRKEIASELRGKAERDTIKALIREAAKRKGVPASTMQAALWYFEQRLYRNHGINSDSTNFSGAAVQAAEKRGVDPGGGYDVQGTSEGEVPPVQGTDEQVLYQHHQPRDPRGALVLDETANTRVIHLFEGSDPSTFLHESAHLFLDLIQKYHLEGATNLDADVNTLFKFMNVSNWSQVGQREQEMFAEVFEQYLFTGQAPSNELKSVFATIRDWLIGVYQEMINIGITGVQITPEVRGVLDRMLATDIEIAAFRESRIYDSPLRGQDVGMTDSEAERFEELQTRAVETAKERMLARLLKDITDKRTQEYQEKIEAEKDLVSAEMATEPLWQIYGWLRWQTDITNPEWPKIAPEKRVKLNRDQVEELIGPEAARQLPGGYTSASITAKDGMDVDAFANQYGYEVSRTMLEDILNISHGISPQGQRQYHTLRDIVAREAEGRVAEAEGHTLEPERLQAEADAALHNEDRSALLTLELNVLRRLGAQRLTERGAERQVAEEGAGTAAARQADVDEAETALEVLAAEARRAVARPLRRAERASARQAGQATTVNRAVVRELARRYVDGMTVRELGALEKFTQNELKMSRLVERSISRKEWGDAAAYKWQQLWNHFVYIEARKAQQKRDAILRRFQRANRIKGGRTSRVDAEYLNRVWTLLDAYNAGPGMTDPNLAREQLPVIEEWVEARNAEGAQIVYPYTVTDGQAVDIISYTRLQELDAAVKSLLKNGRAVSAEERHQFDMFVDDIVRRIEANTRARNRDEFDSARDTAQDAFDWALGTHRKMENLFRELDGYEDGGTIWSNMFRPIAEAEDAERDMRGAAQERLKELNKLISHRRNRREWSFRRYQVGSHTVNRDTLHAIALNWGNEGNRDAMLNGGLNWTEAEFEEAIALLDDRELDYIQGMWDFLDTYWEDQTLSTGTVIPGIKNLETEMSGVAPEKIRPRQFVVVRPGQPDRVMRGGYYPIYFNPKKSDKASRDAETAQRKNEMMGGTWSRAATRHGHTNARRGSHEKAVTTNTSVIYQHLDQVIHDLTHRKAILDVSRILNNNKFREALRTGKGVHAAGFIDKWLMYVASGQMIDKHFLDPTLRHLRVGLSIAEMGFSIRTALVQPLGITQSVARLGVGRVLDGLATFYAHPNENMRDIMAKSVMMRNRMTTLDREIADASRGLKPDNKADTFRSWAFWLIGALDLSVSMPTWMAAYKQALNERGLDEKGAIAHADSVVRMTQSSGAAKDLAAVSRGPEIGKIAAAFYTFFSAYQNMVIDAAGTTQLTYRERGVTAASIHGLSQFTWLVALPALLSAWALDGGPDEDDEEGWAEWAAKEALRYGFGGIVGVREVANAALGDFQGYSGPAVIRVVDTAINAVTSIFHLLTDEERAEVDKALVRDNLMTFGYLFKMPSRQLWRFIEAWWDAQEESPETVETLATIGGLRHFKD